MKKKLWKACIEFSIMHYFDINIKYPVLLRLYMWVYVRHYQNSFLLWIFSFMDFLVKVQFKCRKWGHSGRVQVRFLRFHLLNSKMHRHKTLLQHTDSCFNNILTFTLLYRKHYMSQKNPIDLNQMTQFAAYNKFYRCRNLLMAL